MNIGRTATTAVLTVTAGGLLFASAANASAPDRSAAPAPGMARMQELMAKQNPGMARMHELMTEQNPGMLRMHELMTNGPR